MAGKRNLDLEIEAFLALPTSQELVNEIEQYIATGGKSDWYRDESYWRALNGIGYTEDAHWQAITNPSRGKRIPQKYYLYDLTNYVRDAKGLNDGGN